MTPSSKLSFLAVLISDTLPSALLDEVTIKARELDIHYLLAGHVTHEEASAVKVVAVFKNGKRFQRLYRPVAYLDCMLLNAAHMWVNELHMVFVENESIDRDYTNAWSAAG